MKKKNPAIGKSETACHFDNGPSWAGDGEQVVPAAGVGRQDDRGGRGGGQRPGTHSSVHSDYKKIFNSASRLPLSYNPLKKKPGSFLSLLFSFTKQILVPADFFKELFLT
jgi:hypothetical protein